MQKRHIQIGTKLNLFTVVDYDTTAGKYILQCSCGKTTKYNSAYIKKCLKNGKAQGCFECTKNLIRPNMRLKDFEGAKRNVFSNYKQAAKRRKYLFELSEEEFFKIIVQNCFYCNEPPNMTLRYKKRRSYDGFKFNGVDRINNIIGYTFKNCVPCCKICNNSKSTLSKQEWFEWLKKIVKHTVLI